MTKDKIHQALTHTVLSPTADVRDVLLYMALLHTHNIQLKPGFMVEDIVQNDLSKPLVLPAITRRHAASVVASLWPDDENKRRYEYWYSLYNKTTPYEALSEMPAEELARLMELRGHLLRDPRVESVVESV
jgi:hypothetical protein